MDFGSVRVDILAQPRDHEARVTPAGPFDLAHAETLAGALERAESQLGACRSIELDLAEVTRVDGAGAVLLARLLDRLEAGGRLTRVVAGDNRQAARLIALHRERQSEPPAAHRQPNALARLGQLTANAPRGVGQILDFIGAFTAAVPKAVRAPHSMNWRSLPKLIQDIGADSLAVTSAANLLVGAIIAFLGVSQLGRFGATAFVPELVIVVQFRELGPLVTAIVVAGRSGAGIASEIATMNVSEEVDALRAMGFDPVRWVVFPRCLALVAVLPILTWVGDVVAVGGGLLATTAITSMPPRAYLAATADAITGVHFLTGLIKTPFLGLAIALIACGQGLAARGGAAGVGARTTNAVVLAIFSVIVINAVFTLFYVLAGV